MEQWHTRRVCQQWGTDQIVSLGQGVLMRNAESWRPTKYIVKSGVLRASRDPAHVGVGSRLVTDRIAALYHRFLGRYATGRLLDLGCGSAPLFGVYGPLVSETICVDWPESPHLMNYVDLEHNLNLPLPFCDSSFDTVLLSDVLEHIYRPQELIGEIARVTNESGRVLINVPFLYWLHEEPHDFYRYTEFALRRLLSEAGLEVVEFEVVGGAPEVLCDILGKSLTKVPWMGPMVASAIQWSTGVFVGTGPGKRASASSSRKFPLGYFIVAGKSADSVPKGRREGFAS